MQEIVFTEKDKKVIDSIEKKKLCVLQVPERVMTEAVCCYLAKEFPYALYSLPQKKKTKLVVLTAVSFHGHELKIVDEEDQNYEMAMAAIKNDSYALEYVSKALYTQELFMLAVSKEPQSLNFVPRRRQRYALCKAAIEKDGNALEYMRRTLIDPPMCKLAIENNGLALEFVPHKFITKEMCIQAVQNNGGAVKYVPEELLDDEIYNNVASNDKLLLTSLPKVYHTKEKYAELVANDGMALKDMDKRRVTEEICRAAVCNTGIALQFVPPRYLGYELCKVALDSSTIALRYVPEKLLTIELLEMALTKDSESLKYVNDKYQLSYEMCKRAVEVNGYNIKYVHEKTVTEELCVIAIRNNPKSSMYIPLKFMSNLKVLAVERELGISGISRGWFECGKFCVEEIVPDNQGHYSEIHNRCENYVVSRFDKFDDFYRIMHGNLDKADLSGYEFKGINMSDYDLSECKIDNSVLKKHNMLNNSFHQGHIKRLSQLRSSKFAKSEIGTEMALRFDEYDNIRGEDKPIYYVSDLHLDFKLAIKFPKQGTYREILSYIESVVSDIVESAQYNRNKTLLIGGDVSFDFEINKLFYQELTRKWNASDIIVVLGNHELWGDNVDGVSCTLTDVINKYKEMSLMMGFTLLMNDVCLFKKGLYNFEKEFLSESEILNLSDDELVKQFYMAPFAIMGGTGFSGFNKNFNANVGMYKNTIQTLEKDMEETLRFKKVYDRLTNLLGDRKIIVLTHMPKEDWSPEKIGRAHV